MHGSIKHTLNTRACIYILYYWQYIGFFIFVHAGIHGRRYIHFDGFRIVVTKYANLFCLFRRLKLINCFAQNTLKKESQIKNLCYFFASVHACIFVC